MTHNNPSGGRQLVANLRSHSRDQSASVTRVVTSSQANDGISLEDHPAAPLFLSGWLAGIALNELSAQ
jgi:hypothetical protein